MVHLLYIKRKSTGALAGILLLAGMASCSDDDAPANAITLEEAINAIDATLASRSNGIVKIMAEASQLAMEQGVYTQNPDIACGQPYTAEYDVAAGGTNYIYEYAGTRNYQITCNGSIPATFLYNLSMEGTYETPRVVSDDDATAGLTLTGLAPTVTEAVLNGSYQRNGYQEGKTAQQHSFTSTITYSLNAVTLNKATHNITGGTATVTFTGIGTDGHTYNFNGALTFNNNDTATVTINSTVYIINL